MTRKEFFKSVLTDAGYASIGKAFDGFEEKANDLACEIRNEIEKIMERLYAVKNSTEFLLMILCVLLLLQNCLTLCVNLYDSY